MIIDNAILDTIGTEVDSNKSISTVFKENGLDWEVLQKPVHDSVVDVHNSVINYRSDNNGFLGIVSNSHYKVVNNIDAFNFIDDLNSFTMEKVGMMNEGQEVFVVGKMNTMFEISENDQVQLYASFIHGHNGKSAIRLIITPIRMFCTNQLNLMLSNAAFSYSIRHSGDVYNKLCRIQQAFNMNTEYMLELGTKLHGMTQAEANMSIDDFLDKLIPLESESTKVVNRRENIISTIRDLYNNKDDNQNYKGTQFGMLNAVADYVSHQKIKQFSPESNTKAFFKSIENNELLNKAHDILMAA